MKRALQHETKRVRTKLRAPFGVLRRRTGKASPRRAATAPSDTNEAARAVTAAASAVVVGLDLCARRTRDPAIAVAAASAAGAVRRLVTATLGLAPTDVARRSRTGDRLRWEWLASTGMMLDGDADARVLAECARILGEAVATTDLHTLGSEIAARFRLASAEAYSLAVAARNQPRRELLRSIA